MEAERFEHFNTCIDAISKYIKQLKAYFSAELGVKSVHTFWLYVLLSQPEGMTPAEIANRCMVDPSLISREIEMLEKNELLLAGETDHSSRRRYNNRYTLTEKGKTVAKKIQEIALSVQKNADKGISAEELHSFYITLDKLCINFSNMQKTIIPNTKETTGHE